MAEITIRGRRLAYAAQPADFDPKQPAAVFIHGSGGDRDDWRAQLDGLSDRITVIALELPGHGASEPPGESSVDEYARWVTDFVEGLGLERVLLVGCSLGSAITLWIALNPPPWLTAIGLVGGGARLRVHPSFLEGLKRDAENTLRLLAQYALSEKPDERLLSDLTDKFFANSPDLILGDLTACDRFDVLERLSEAQVPTVILVGEEDRLTPVKYSKALDEQIPNSELHVIPGAGHLVMEEQPERFNELLGDYATRILG